MAASNGKSASLKDTGDGVWTFTSLWRSGLESRTTFSGTGALSRQQVSQETSITRAYPGVISGAIELPFGAVSMSRRNPLRIIRTDTSGGTDMMPWLNSERRATSAPSITFRMTTGEIDWRLVDQARSAEAKRIPDFQLQLDRLRSRMLATKNVLNLPKERMILDDGRRNYFTIKLYTPMDPGSVTITGLFGPEGISEMFEGQRPMSMDYEFEFIVLQQEPDNEEAIARLESLMPESVGQTTALDRTGSTADGSRATVLPSNAGIPYFVG